MSDIHIILKYFPDLSDDQIRKFSELGPLYKYWNERINLISRKDIDQIYLRHILHSLAIAAFIRFKPGSRVLDVGTGGGFPGIPLSIMFPEVKFTLIDSIGKKIKVVSDILDKTGLSNTSTQNIRAENLNSKYDYVISRAVTNMPLFYKWTSSLLSKRQEIKPDPGIIALKGGDLEKEMGKLFSRAKIIPIRNYFDEDFFDSKMIVYLPLK